MKRRKPIRRISSKQTVIKYCDKLFFEILKIERGNRCEACGRLNPAPHHVFSKGTYPKLRFRKDNIVLLCWQICHFPIHHYTHDDPQYRRVMDKIKELIGANYRDRLLIADKCAPVLNPTYLGVLRAALRQELKELRK